MSGFVISDLAYEDIQEAAEYLDAQTGDPEAGTRLIDELEQAFARLASLPDSGVLRPELDPGLHSSLFGRYTIFYYVFPGFIEIARVLHQRRDIKRAFGIE